jgi:hypothetical protein
MRNPYQVLREKERELEEVKREVEALRLVGPLLEGEDTPSEEPAKSEPESAQRGDHRANRPRSKMALRYPRDKINDCRVWISRHQCGQKKRLRPQC